MNEIHFNGTQHDGEQNDTGSRLNEGQKKTEKEGDCSQFLRSLYHYFTPKESSKINEETPLLSSSTRAELGSKEDFCNKCISLLEEDGKPVSDGLKESLQQIDRRKIGIWEVREKWDSEVAAAFGAARGLVVQGKAANSVYDESLAGKMKEYKRAIARCEHSKWIFGSPRDANYIFGSITYEKGNITVDHSYREPGSQVPHLASQLGYLWHQGWKNIKEGKDDNNRTIQRDSSKADEYRKLHSLTRDMPLNQETIDTILILFEKEILNGQRVIKVTEAEREPFLCMLGIPNGYAAPFLAEFRSGPNERLFGETKVISIEIELSGILMSKSLDRIREIISNSIDSRHYQHPGYQSLKIKKITYYFGQDLDKEDFSSKDDLKITPVDRPIFD